MSRAIVVQAGPLAASSATKISASQKAAAALYLVMNGAAGVATANNICASQTPAGAGALTLNGTLATTNPIAGAGGTAAVGAAVAYLPTPSRLYATFAGNDSGNTLTIVGTIQTPGTFGTGIVVSETMTGGNVTVVSSANIYSTITSITISGAAVGAITVGTYGPATLDAARQVLFTSGGNDSAVTVALAGTDWAGNAISETVALTNGSTIASVLSYLTVTSMLTSAAIATTITVGTNSICSSPWARLDEYAAMGPTSIQVDGSGTVNWTVQQSLNDPNSTSNPITPANMHWVNHPDTGLVAQTTITGVQGNYAYPPKLARIVMNSNGGATAYAAMTIMQNYQK